MSLTKGFKLDFYTEKCIGCKIYQDVLRYEFDCNFVNRFSSTMCPCLDCLLKGICSDTCDDYDNMLKVNVKTYE